MAQNDLHAKSENSEQKSVRSYTPPAIREFGPVGALTQSGTGTMGENAQDMGAMRQMI